HRERRRPGRKDPDHPRRRPMGREQPEVRRVFLPTPDVIPAKAGTHPEIAPLSGGVGSVRSLGLIAWSHPLPNPPRKGEGAHRGCYSIVSKYTERHPPPCGGLRGRSA